MKFDASFVASHASVDTLPTAGLPEIALIGRSNVGKSSLINALTERKQLAKTSSTPGKTQLLNYFLVNKAFHLVDMPGYGYAKNSKSKRIDWAKIAERYFLERHELGATGVLIDSRHPLLESDGLVLHWFEENNLPFFVVLTKTDKCRQSEVALHEKILATEIPTAMKICTTSSEKGKGIRELRDFISNLAFSSNQSVL